MRAKGKWTHEPTDTNYDLCGGSKKTRTQNKEEIRQFLENCLLSWDGVFLTQTESGAEIKFVAVG